jgi:hypothetical protein
MKTLRFLSMMLMAVGFSFMVSCGDSDDSSGNGEENSSSNIGAFINTNPDVSTQFIFSNKKGEMAIISGQKDAQGAPTKIESMVVKNADQAEKTYIYMNSNELIERITAPNGVEMTFDWVGAHKAAVTLVDPSTGEQLNTVVDFANQNAGTRSINYDAPMRSGEAKMTLEPTKHENVPVTQAAMTRATLGFTGDITVKVCDAPSDVHAVYVEVFNAFIGHNTMPSKGDIIVDFKKCDRVGTGHYQFHVPDNYSGKANIGSICSKIDAILFKICKYNTWTVPGSGAKEYLCMSISAALTTAGVGISAPVAAAFLSACLAASVSIDTACSLANGGLPIPDEFGQDENSGIEGISTKLCNLLKEYNASMEGVFVQPHVYYAGKNNYFDGTWLTSTQKYDEILSFGNFPSINSFTLSPSAPAANQGYKAIAKLSCMKKGTKIVMDIVGTDGYQKTETTTVSDDTIGEFTATMSVPGSYAGVQDQVNINVTTPDGAKLHKSASLVFGK